MHVTCTLSCYDYEMGRLYTRECQAAVGVAEAAATCEGVEGFIGEAHCEPRPQEALQLPELEAAAGECVGEEKLITYKLG